MAEVCQFKDIRKVARQRGEQLELKKQLVVIDNQNASSNPDVNLDDMKYVAGADVSFPECKDDLVHASAAFVVISIPDLQVVYEDCSMIHLTAPYIPEYLAFREAQFFEQAFNKVKIKSPEFLPQVLLIDGNGILHPRGFGIASHVGVLIDIPTVGVAKKLFHVDGLEKNEEHTKKISDLLKKAGDTFPLVGNSGKILGQALRSTNQSSKPVYVSVGHKISLEKAVDIVATCCKYRIPEAVRQADILSREHIKKDYDDHIRICQLDWREKSEINTAIAAYFSTLKQQSIKNL